MNLKKILAGMLAVVMAAGSINLSASASSIETEVPVTETITVTETDGETVSENELTTESASEVAESNDETEFISAETSDSESATETEVDLNNDEDYQALVDEFYATAQASYDEDMYEGQQWYLEDSVDSYLANTFNSYEGIATMASQAVGTMNYDKWVIAGGAGFGKIWEDGRDLDHVGIFQINVTTANNGITKGWKTAYCVHHNSNSQGGHTYKDIAAYLTNTQKKNLTGLALQFGLHTFSGGWNQTKNSYPAVNDMKMYLATQVMVWIIEKGWYSYPTNGIFQPNSKALTVAKTICNKSGSKNRAGASYDTFTALLTNMQNYDKMPSFTNRASASRPTHTMKYNISTKQYSLTLTDTNKVLSQCEITSKPSNVSASINGNTLTLMSSSPITGTAGLTFAKKSFNGSDAVIVWSDRTNTSYQQLSTYAVPAVISMYSYASLAATTTVTMDVKKIWEDNNNAANIRPASLKVELWMGLSSHAKTTKLQEITLNDANNWFYSVSNLAKTDKDGKNIYYSFFEADTENYTSSLVESNVGTNHWQYTFTNTLSGKVNLPAEKIWDDNDDELGIRPNELVVEAIATTEDGIESLAATGTMNADTDWKYTFTGLPGFDAAGKEITYSVIEIVPDNYEGKVELVDGTYVLTNTVTLVDVGSIVLEKTSMRPDLTDGNAMYSLADAVYGIYTDESCTEEAKIGELITEADGRTNRVSELDYGKYYVKEITAPDGFIVDETVYPVEIKEDITLRNVTLRVRDNYMTSKVSLLKESANPEMTTNNSCYSLAGAEYGVYSDKDCTQSVGTLTTDEEGNTNQLTDLIAGTYYVKENVAPKGFALDIKVYEIVINPDEDYVLKVKDTPLNDPIVIQMSKHSSDGAVSEAVYPLDGTEFTINYYGQYGLTDDTLSDAIPLRTWVIKVIGIKGSGESALYYTTLSESYIVTEKSDVLFYDEYGKPVIPLGTITVAETKAAPKYTINGYVTDDEGNVISDNPSKPLIFEIDENYHLKGTNGIVYNGLEFSVVDEPCNASIRIIKHDAHKNALEGVEFTLTTEEGDIVANGLTDENGQLTFENLKEGAYQLTETATVNGEQLLKDPIKLTLPMTFTPEQVEAQNIDRDKCVYDATNNIYLVYDVTYEISNSVNMTLPVTGGADNIYTYLPLLIGILLLAGVMLFLVKKRSFHLT